MDSLTLKRNNSFQSQNNRKVTHSFAPWSLIPKLQEEVLKFIGYLFELELLKNWPGDKLLNPES